jgi:hypothetical protein
VITSKPAINDHFKTGQRSRTQDMKLFYRDDGSLSKLFLISFYTHHAQSRPTGGRRECFRFSFIERFCFGFYGVAGAKPRSGKIRQSDSLCGSRGGCRRFGAPTARATLEHVPMMQYAIEHRGHRCHVAQ